VLSLGGGRGYGVKRAGKAISCLLTCFFSSICCYLQDNVTSRFCLRSFKVPGEGKTDIAVPSLGGGRGYDVKRALSHLFFLLHLLLFTREAISCLFTCFFPSICCYLQEGRESNIMRLHSSWTMTSSVPNYSLTTVSNNLYYMCNFDFKQALT
jgi:hypothetical protein